MNRRGIVAVAGAVVATVLVLVVTRPGEPDTVKQLQPAWDSLPRNVDVEVLNGTRARGVARNAALKLQEGLLDVVWFGDADREWQGRARTAVVVRRRDTTGVGRVREVLGDVEVIDRYDESRVVDLTVVIGTDFVARAGP